MKNKRHIFESAGSGMEFDIEVIGLHCVQDGFYRGTGIPAWRIMMFHSPIQIIRAGTIQTIEENTLFIFPENEEVSYGRNGEKSWNHSWIRLKGSEAVSDIIASGIPFNTPVKFDDYQESDKWLSLIIQELNEPQPDIENIKMLFRVWLRKIRRKCIGSTSTTPSPLQAVKRFIETNYTKKLTLKQLAERAYMSPPYFCEEFKKHFNVSPVDYMIRLRLKNAAMLLDDHNISVKEAAGQSGYDDVYYFSKLFKKKYGLSPSAFRANSPKQS